MFAIPVEGGVATATASTDGGDYTIIDKPEGLNLVPGAWAPDNSEVVLDGCGSTGAAHYLWVVGGAAGPIESSECETRVRLPEGRHELALTVSDSGGRRYRADPSRSATCLVGLGDSFSAGSGDSRSGLVAADYDQAHCTRSGRSGQARAALEMERRDPKTSVTFITSPARARADFGLLGAQRPTAAASQLSRSRRAGRGLRLLHDQGNDAPSRDHRAAIGSPTRPRISQARQTHGYAAPPLSCAGV
jgi:hypothetical protein